MTTVYIDLTWEQMETIQPINKLAIAADDGGKPGMVVGQFAGDRVRVGFLPYEKALLLVKKDADGNPKTIKSFG